MLRRIRHLKVIVDATVGAQSRQLSSQHELASLGTLLVANRGEIACRVMKTARLLGINTVGVFSEADRQAMHVRMADCAVHIGPAPPKASYLNIDKILETADRVGAGAVHPGYGFLSENADFVQRCEDAGLIFVGPPASAIASMGNKSAAKRIMQEAGVPVVPGYHGPQMSAEEFAAEAERVGYPVLIKAELGGGGKGMKIATSAREFPDAFASAQREAMASFGDSRMLLERLIQKPRHVEVQILADHHGECLYLFERDCSVQRRHQKIIEEAPAPLLSEVKRRELGEAAVAAAKAVGYVGAGTVEFILDTESQEFHFMEMNTRLQVEHPITELISGMDLVEMQLRVAAGQTMPLTQQQLKRSGHAFEARIYAEQPHNGFLPCGGTIAHWCEPPHSQAFGLSRSVPRVDAALRVGDEVGVHYDPMIAKLITWGEDRDEALSRMQQSLAGLQVGGLPTNIDFLQKLAKHPAFVAAELDTGFIERHADELLAVNPVSTSGVAVAFIARMLLTIRDEAENQAAELGRPQLAAPWSACDGFRLSHKLTRSLVMGVQRGTELQTLSASVTFLGDDAFEVTVEDATHHVIATLDAPTLSLVIDGVSATASTCLYRAAAHLHLDVWLGNRHCHFTWPENAWEEYQAAGQRNSRLVSPMTAKVSKVNARVGQAVQAGDVVVVVEAMKMEHAVLAPAAGTVTEIPVKEGQQVQDADVLAVLEFSGSDVDKTE